MKLLIVGGTRPEIIKCAPIYLEARRSKKIEVAFCNTGQHREMAAQVFDVFKIKPEFDMAIMKKNQTLNDISSALFKKFTHVLNETKPDYVMVQGDTSTAFITALISFNLKYRIIHLEAGLRSFNLAEPFPEEANRKLISAIATIFLCPTENNRQQLLKENITENLFVVGNSVVDALNYIQREFPLNVPDDIQPKLRTGKYVLITSHRRENFGEGLKNICKAIKYLADRFREVDFIYPVHLNPNVLNEVMNTLSGVPNIILIKPVNYIEMLGLIKNCMFCISDSGGVQEEAPSFNKYVIVLRNYTERMESIHMGFSELAGTDYDKIIGSAIPLLESESALIRVNSNPYGDGNTSEKVIGLLSENFRN
jgi:UDP-N-acetylglucosamine 2-epimerase (non-hydrolysing)